MTVFDDLRAWEACTAPHGTTTRYQAGCRCTRCTTDHMLIKRVWKWQQGEGVDRMRAPVGDWAEQAACKGCDPQLWHPSNDPGQTGRPAHSSAKEAEAKRVCRTCPVQDECLEHALEQDERLGVWGGLGPKDRERLKRGVRKRCDWCGDVFATDNRNRLTCSEECRRARKNARQARWAKENL